MELNGLNAEFTSSLNKKKYCGTDYKHKSHCFEVRKDVFK